MNNKIKNGFTLIELLAVIIILGLLMIIAIPAVTKYISESRKEAYIDTVKEIITGARNYVNSGKLDVYDTDVVYYIPSSCIATENSSRSPYGDFKKAYVAVTYEKDGYNYYWQSVDTSGTGISKLKSIKNLSSDDIETSIKEEDLKFDYSIGGRTTARIFNENCKSFTDSENGLTMKSTIEKLSQTNVSTNNTSDENPSTTYLRTDDYGNIRYIGSNPPNYAKFEDSDKLWRIIGIVDGDLKLISVSNEYMQYNTNGTNDWTTSSLKEYLNGTYYNNLSEKTKDAIISHNYKLGGYSTGFVVAKDIYMYERGNQKYSNNPIEWNGKIALMYPSDYGYSTQSNECLNTNIYDYSRNGNTCAENSWLFMTSHQWLLNPSSVDSSKVFRIYSTGCVDLNIFTQYTVTYSTFKSRPVIHVKSSIGILSGTGTQSNPYVLGKSSSDIEE